MNWLIALPCWGDEHSRIFLETTLPALRFALKSVGGRVRWLIHTDRRNVFRAAMPVDDVTFRSVPMHNDSYWAFGHCHRDALAFAERGEAIAFHAADLIVSGECFAAAERQFIAGKRVIFAQAARTWPTAPSAPIGMPARALLEWSFANRHPYTRSCFWGSGCTKTGWGVYFESQSGIVLRAFHLHPFAAVNDRPLKFDRTTVDLDLVECFSLDEIHVVTDPDEMGLAEYSPAERVNPISGEVLSIASVLSWAMQRVAGKQLHLFEHRIVVQGDGSDQGDVIPANIILGAMTRYLAQAA